MPCRSRPGAVHGGEGDGGSAGTTCCRQKSTADILGTETIYDPYSETFLPPFTAFLLRKYLSRADYYGGSQLPWPLQITTHHTIRLADYYTSTLQITSMERATRTHTLHTIGLGADTSAGTLSPAVAPGPDCWTHSTQLTGQLTRWRYVVVLRD